MNRDQNKHWYDGWIYELFIAKHIDQFSHEILELIDENKNILDVGCGTGRLTLSLAPKCSSVTGIDLSSKNIAVAESNLEKAGFDNVSFVCSDAAEFRSRTDKIFDYTILSFVIHEVPLELRSNLIEAVKQISKKIIFADYLYPELKGLKGFFIRIIEFLAGREHFSGFESYMLNKGLSYIVESNGLRIIREIRDDTAGRHILLTN